MFAWLYFAFAIFIYLLAALPLAFLSLREKYKISIPKRFFAPKIPHNCEIWLHACSLGEINSLAFLDEFFKKNNKKILITTITNTGFARANELFSKNPNVEIAFLPFEIFLFFYRNKHLKTLVVLEAELWFGLFLCAKKNGAKTLLLNARISQKSLPKYKKFAFFYRQIFKNIDKVFAQSAQDKENLAQIGAKNIEILGNIKSLNPPKINKNYPYLPNLIIAASTHKGEEELILHAFLNAFNELENPPILLIFPRHPHRFNEVWDLLKNNPKADRFSQSCIESALKHNKNIILIDTLGELINFYAIADLVILGGSFEPIGGHNPLECAHFQTKILSGEFIFNQNALFNLVNGAKIIKKNELENMLKNYKNLPKTSIKSSALESMKNTIIGELNG